MNEEITIVIISERVRDSLAKDIGVFALFVSLIGIGWLIGSTALQWVGAIIGFITILAWAARIRKENRFTVSEARKRLDEIEAGK